MAARAERADRFILRETGKVYALLADATQDAERLHAESGRVQRVIAVHDEMAFFRAGDVAYESKGSTR